MQQKVAGKRNRGRNSLANYYLKLSSYLSFHPILKFKEEQFLARIDKLLAGCAQQNIPTEITKKINAITLSYISNCKLQKLPRILDKTKKWLKDNDIMAVPSDKGTGF